MKKVFIIAEAGVNHNGNIDLAYQLIDEAVNAGVDCVKFQTYITENDTTRNCEKADYQKVDESTENQFEMIKGLELSFDDFKKLKEYCDKNDIIFLSSPFDLDSIEFLESLNPVFWKIASSEVTNYPFLRKIALTHRPIVMSTGMCTIDEISNAIDVLHKYGAGNITLLHCNTEYPTPMNDVNLLSMNTLKTKFNTKVGYSDHTLGIEVPIAAVSLGAEIIEKHFTLDKKMEGPDHKASLNPKELKDMVVAIRNIEKAIGNGIKKPSDSEMKNRISARKSIVANKKIKKGEAFNDINLAAKRPGGGISPMRWEEFIGKIATKDYIEDEMIEDA
ncbi:N-acetylneuraminate synthase [[Clostridium] innocuum]|nr:N-acetylneuraminate synthase [[Clostridium] innocuum]